MATPIIGPEDHWLLAGLNRLDLEPLLAAGSERRYLAGDVIFHEGESSDGLYLILAGAIQVTASGGRGEGQLAVARTNEVIGEMGVLDGAPRSGTAKAITMCRTFFVPTEPFLDLLERSTLVCMRLLVLLSARLRRADALIVARTDVEEVTIE